MLRLIVLLFSVGLPFSVVAGVTCEEKITKIRLHYNGGIYFFTEKACLNRCLLQWDSEDKKESGLAALLAARTADMPVAMHWPDLDSCELTNSTDSSPNFIDF